MLWRGASYIEWDVGSEVGDGDSDFEWDVHAPVIFSGTPDKFWIGAGAAELNGVPSGLEGAPLFRWVFDVLEGRG